MGNICSFENNASIFTYNDRRDKILKDMKQLSKQIEDIKYQKQAKIQKNIMM
jgi:hypothetical protein